MDEEYSTIKKIDDSTIEINDYTEKNYKKVIFIKYSVILAFLLGCAATAIFFIVRAADTKEAPPESMAVVVEEIEETAEAENVPFTENGFLFPYSDRQFISEAEVLQLKELSEESDFTYQELLRYSINEIYARRGFQFKENGTYDVFYNNFGWYQNMEKKEITWEMFNVYEQYNINLLVTIEKDNGYR